MNNITKPSNPVNLDSGQRRDLYEIIKNLRNDITMPDNREKGAPAGGENEQPNPAEVKRSKSLLGRAGALRMGLMGIATRIPA